MSNLVFPTLNGLSWDRKRSPVWSTGIQESANGLKLRTAFFSYPIYKYSLSFDLLRETTGFSEKKQIEEFFNLHRGGWDSWLYNDDSDNTATNQVFASTDGVSASYQLKRSINNYLEPIKALNGTPTIYKNGVAQSSDFTISSTGLVTFTTTPAAGITLSWSGQYYFRCRFSDDSLDFNQFVYRLYDLGKVDFETIKI